MDDPGAVNDASEELRSIEASANADNRAVVRNALVGYGAWGVNLALGLVVTPIILRELGTEGFGAWTLAITIASYVAMVELGLGIATSRQVAASLATGDSARASGVAASARAMYYALACLGAVLLATLVLLPGVVVATGDVSPERVRIAVLVLGLGWLLSLAASVYPVVAIGAGRMDIGVTVGTGVRVVTALAQITAVIATGSLVVLSLVTATGVVVGTLAVRGIARRNFPDIDVSYSNASRAMARLLLASGWRTAAIGVSVAVAIQSDVLVVGFILGPAAVAAYGIAVRAFTMVRELATRASDVLVPTFAHTTTIADNRRTLTAFRESVLLTRAILLPALITLVAFGEPLLQLWLGDAPEDANLVLVLLVLGAMIAAPGHSAFVLLTGMNRLGFLLVGASITAVANVALSILLTWNLGIVGPVLGSIAGFIVWDLVLLPRHVGEVLRIPWLPLSTAGLSRLLLPGIAAAVIGWLLSDRLGWSSPWEGLAGALIVSIVYVCVLSITLGSDRRARYRRLLVGATRPIKHPS